jgi:hypothetical protein
MAMSYASSRTQQSTPTVQVEPSAPELQPWGNSAMGEELAGLGECAPEPEQWGQAPEGGEAWWASEEEGEMGICAEGGSVMQQLEAELMSSHPREDRVLNLCGRLSVPEIHQLCKTGMFSRLESSFPELASRLLKNVALDEQTVREDRAVQRELWNLRARFGLLIKKAAEEALQNTCGQVGVYRIQGIPEQSVEVTLTHDTVSGVGLDQYRVRLVLGLHDDQLLLTPTGRAGGVLVTPSGFDCARVEGLDVTPEWQEPWDHPTFEAWFDSRGNHTSGTPGEPEWENARL